jgi:hypothetical protein
MFIPWDTFIEKVREYLTVDGVRKGSLTQRYVERVAKAGAIDLQSFVPSLKPHFRQEYAETDLSGDKEYGADVARGDFAASASSVLSVHVEDSKGNPRRIEITSGAYSPDLPRRGFNQFRCGSISFRSCGFSLRPPLKTDEKLVIRYVSEVSEFEAGDRVPFDERCVKMVGEFIKAHISREVDKDLNLYKSYMEGYLRERAIYHVDHKDYLPECINNNRANKYDSEEMSLETKILTAGEDLFAGDLVSMSPAGVLRASSLDASTSCDGFVVSNYSSGGDALIHFEGLVPGTDFVVGSRYYLSASKGSKSVTSPPSGISQFIGRAVTATEINFEPDQAIKL